MALATAGVLAAPASAATQHEFDVQPTSPTPGASTGVVVHHVYPDGGDGRPKRVKRAVYDVAVEFHHDAMPTCEATDDDIYSGGLEACAAETALGQGTATAITGAGAPVDPLELDVHMFHGPSEEIYVFTPRGSERPVLNVARAKVSGHTIVDEPTYPPGFPPSDGKSALRRIDVTYAPASPGYLTTPEDCPASGQWVSHVDITYTDETHETADSTAPCTAAAATVPDTALLRHPARRTRSHRARFAFSASVAGARFECRHRGAWHTCSSPIVLAHLRRGKHVFRVRAVVGDVVDPSPAVWRFTVLR